MISRIQPIIINGQVEAISFHGYLLSRFTKPTTLADLQMTEWSPHCNRPYDRDISIGHSHLVTLLSIKEIGHLRTGDIRINTLQLGIKLIPTT